MPEHVAVSPDGQWIAVGSRSLAVYRFGPERWGAADPLSGPLMASYKGLMGPVFGGNSTLYAGRHAENPGDPEGFFRIQWANGIWELPEQVGPGFNNYSAYGVAWAGQRNDPGQDPFIVSYGGQFTPRSGREPQLSGGEMLAYLSIQGALRIGVMEVRPGPCRDPRWAFGSSFLMWTEDDGREMWCRSASNVVYKLAPVEPQHFAPTPLRQLDGTCWRLVNGHDRTTLSPIASTKGYVIAGPGSIFGIPGGDQHFLCGTFVDLSRVLVVWSNDSGRIQSAVVDVRSIKDRVELRRGAVDPLPQPQPPQRPPQPPSTPEDDDMRAPKVNITTHFPLPIGALKPGEKAVVRVDDPNNPGSQLEIEFVGTRDPREVSLHVLSRNAKGWDRSVTPRILKL